MKYLKVFIVLFFSFLMVFCNVQKNNDTPPDNVDEFKHKNVVISGSLTSVNEVSIAVNPKNPQNLVAGSNLNWVYFSNDGGNNWTVKSMNSSLGVWGDPSVIFDSKGNVYFAHLSNPSNGKWIDRIVIQKSTDEGESWSDGVGVGLNFPKEEDKEWLVADHTNSKYKDRLYMSWTEFDNYGSTDPKDRSRILASFSANSGSTWSKPYTVSDNTGNCIDSDDTMEGAVPAIGPTGDVYISWGGPDGIYFDKSSDGGVSYGKDILISKQIGGWDHSVSGINRCNGMPITGCDISNSSYKGNIYVCWSDQRNGDTNIDVFIISSSDQGQTWTKPKRVNDDQTQRQQFFPWMSIDPKTGNIYIVFYDRRDTTGEGTDVYIAKSKDGGQTFSNHKVNESTFIPSASVFIGDYNNIAAYNGMVYPIWIKMVNGERSALIAIVDDQDNSL